MPLTERTGWLMARGKRMVVATDQQSFHVAVRARRARMNAAKANGIRLGKGSSRGADGGGYYHEDMVPRPTSAPNGGDIDAAPTSNSQRRPTRVPTEIDLDIIGSIVRKDAERRDKALAEYGSGADVSRDAAILGKATRVMWVGELMSTTIFPEGLDPYDTVVGNRILALAGLASDSLDAPPLTRAELLAHIDHADRQGRYGDEPLKEHSAAPTDDRSERADRGSARGVRQPNVASSDGELDDLVAEAERELERLTPAYDSMRTRARDLLRAGRDAAGSEYEEIRAEAATAYSPLAHIALRAELARATELYRGDRTDDRRRLVLTLVRELSFSLALLTIAEHEDDRVALGNTHQALLDAEELLAGINTP